MESASYLFVRRLCVRRKCAAHRTITINAALRRPLANLVVTSFCIIGLTLSSLTKAENLHTLSAEERSIALTVEVSSTMRPRVPASADLINLQDLANTPKGASRKSVVISVLPVGSDSTVSRLKSTLPSGSIPSRRALVTRYEYATGLTIRTWIDLEKEKILHIRGDVNYPTPLAETELREAIELLKNKNNEVYNIANEYGNSVQFEHLVPVSSTKSAPRFGHRLVWLWIREPVKTARFLVDLSTGEVVETP